MLTAFQAIQLFISPDRFEFPDTAQESNFENEAKKSGSHGRL